MAGNSDRTADLLPPGVLPALISTTTLLAPFGTDGVRERGSCPLHPDLTASLYVSNNNWYCFGCGASGDAAAWVMRRDAVSRSAALYTIDAFIAEFEG